MLCKQKAFKWNRLAESLCLYIDREIMENSSSYFVNSFESRYDILKRILR